MSKQKIDTKSIGLDVGSRMIKWLTGAENMHYGYWQNLEVNAANLGTAQQAYTDKLFGLLPPAPARILDIGGGAGETAKKLITAGYEVDIVIPSPILAERCRQNAPKAKVHETTFEELRCEQHFDICLFSESFQYIKLEQGLKKALQLISKEGSIILADCFRRESFYQNTGVQQKGIVGGGHRLQAFQKLLEETPVTILSNEDITQAVAPSVDIEQELFNIFGYAWQRVDEELTEKRPTTRWWLAKFFNLLLSKRKRLRLQERLQQQNRNAKTFCDYNEYRMMKLAPT